VRTGCLLGIKRHGRATCVAGFAGWVAGLACSVADGAGLRVYIALLVLCAYPCNPPSACICHLAKQRLPLMRVAAKRQE
jgi:hypothetical protein